MSIAVQYTEHSSINSFTFTHVTQRHQQVITVFTRNRPSPSPCQTASRSRHRAPYHLSIHHSTKQPLSHFFLLVQFAFVLLTTPNQSALIALMKPLVLCPVKKKTRTLLSFSSCLTNATAWAVCTSPPSLWKRMQYSTMVPTFPFVLLDAVAARDGVAVRVLFVGGRVRFVC
jgi:hypothetical protein